MVPTTNQWLLTIINHYKPSLTIIIPYISPWFPSHHQPVVNHWILTSTDPLSNRKTDPIPAAGWSPGMPRIPVLPSPSPPAAPDLDERRDVRRSRRSRGSRGWKLPWQWSLEYLKLIHIDHQSFVSRCTQRVLRLTVDLPHMGLVGSASMHHGTQKDACSALPFSCPALMMQKGLAASFEATKLFLASNSEGQNTSYERQVCLV